MKHKDELREELERLSPFLAKMKCEKEGFIVPKDYFKALPNEVLNKVQQAVPMPEQASWRDKTVLFFQNIWQPRYVLAIASALAILVVAVCFIKKTPSKQEALPVATVQAADIPYEDLHEYLTDNIEDIDEELIVEANLGSKATSAKTSIVPQPTTEELEEYLDDVIDEIDPEDLEDLF